MLSDPLQNMATFGLGKLFPNAGSVARTLGGLLFGMGSEGAEEVLEGMAANKAVGDPNDWSELGYEGLLGALSGGLFGGGGMAVNAIANALTKTNDEGTAAAAPTPKEAAKGSTFTPEQRGELLRWAHDETGRMAEEAQFAEDGTPENPLGETDLARYQEIRDAMKRKDYAALSAMRGEAEDARNVAQQDGEQYEQQGVGPAQTAPRQAESTGARGTVRTRTPAELRQLAKDVEARMIAAGHDVEESKAMGLLASEFAHRFVERTGTEAKDALNIEFRRGKAQEKRGTQGKGYAQSSTRQSEEYDPGDPKTWPVGAARDEALALEAWQNLETNEGIETWPESPEKTEALALRKEYGEIEAWIENLSREEFEQRLRSNDPEFVQKNDRGVDIEERLNALRRALRKKKPKNIEKRLSQLIEAEIDAAQEETLAAQDVEEYYHERRPLAENIRRGQAAMEKVIAEHTDVMDAMYRDDLGSISFLWGEPGRGDKFKGGWGVSHIIAHRNVQGYDGEAVARKMVEVIGKGKITKRYAEDSVDQERVKVTYDGYEAHLGLFRYGKRMTWLITGYEVTKKAPDVSGEGSGSSGTTLLADIPRTDEEGAGAKTNPRSDTPGRDQGLPGATLSETTPPVTEREQSEASDNSKPPVSQKSKRESAPQIHRLQQFYQGSSPS